MKNYSNCVSCPRECNANRFSRENSFCNTGDKPLVSAIIPHKGEEPVISGKNGICNVFFAHCNLACVFCQNIQISENKILKSSWLSDVDLIANNIIKILDTGITMLGFVSPSHQVYQMIDIISKVNSRGYFPTIVYNSNCYDSVKLLRELNDIVDVYLPDFKYFSNELALKYSKVSDYLQFSILALKEMIWQKGTSLLINENGLISSGVIVRHLVLPGHTDDSKNLLTFIANEISPNLSISLMSQYSPIFYNGQVHNLKRPITETEYKEVVDTFYNLGFFRGWIQDIASNNLYLPDFSRELPFNIQKK